MEHQKYLWILALVALLWFIYQCLVYQYYISLSWKHTLLPEVPLISHSPLASSNVTSGEWLVLTSQINSTSPGAPTGWILRILPSSLDQGNVSLLIPSSTTHCLALSKTTVFFFFGGEVSPILLNTTLTALSKLRNSAVCSPVFE